MKQEHIMWTIWRNRVQPFGAAMAQLRQYLELLRTLHPDFGHWQLLGSESYQPVAADLADLEVLVQAASRPRKKDREHYTALDAGHDLTAASLGRDGFSVTLYTSLPGAAAGMARGRADAIELRVNLGSAQGNSANLTYPAGRPDLLEHALVRRILLASNDFWQAERGEVFSRGMIEALEADRRHAIGLLRAAWISYVRHPLLAHSLRDMPCEVERLAGNALLLTLTPHAPDPASASDVSAARRLQVALDQLHFDHDVTFYGWPDDPAEPRYTHQVTGAPLDRAYVVAFCAFDGYDAQRKVLLFARLFRLPPHWGTNLLPYYQENAERLESLPYVVQARQHIAAVRYAGADTPIEWHVGVQENARALKTLLNDWAAIPVEQLRVVYTPFEGQLDKEAPCL